MIDRTKYVYDTIKANQGLRPEAPSVEALGRLLGISISTVRFHIDKLIKSGKLVKHDEGNRVWYEFK